MTIKRVSVNLALFIFLVLVIVWCVRTGKAHNIILENKVIAIEGVEHQPFEAIYVSFGKAPELMLEGDIIIKRAVGTAINLQVDVVDDDDNVLESRVVSFALEELGDSLRINVPAFYAKAGK